LDADASIRAFFAVELETTLREEAGRAAEALRERIDSGVRIRWTRAESWHVTLRFLGNFASDRLGELIALASPCVAELPPFGLRLGAVIAFPPRRVRVLALDLMPHPPLAAVAAALERAAVACGFEPEERPFKPHLTLGRVERGSLRAREVAGGAATGVGVQAVREVVLFRSELHAPGRPGARYTPIERLALDQNVHP